MLLLNYLPCFKEQNVHLSGWSLPILIILYFLEHLSTLQACKKLGLLQLNPQADARAAGVNKTVSILANHGQIVQSILLWTDSGLVLWPGYSSVIVMYFLG